MTLFKKHAIATALLGAAALASATPRSLSCGRPRSAPRSLADRRIPTHHQRPGPGPARAGRGPARSRSTVSFDGLGLSPELLRAVAYALDIPLPPFLEAFES